MIVRIPATEFYFPKYVGWYIAVDRKIALDWENKVRAPADNYLLKQDAFVEPTRFVGTLWAWRKDPESNEFGPVSP